MSKRKLAIVASLKKSHWRSCQVIVPNLIKLYQMAFPDQDLKLFDYNDEMTSCEYDATKKGIIDFQPDALAICDHKPHPGKLISHLVKTFGEDMPPIYCHLFGDFSLYSPGWIRMESYLRRTQIKFIVPSHRQQDFVGQFIQESKALTEYLPFPVDEEKFHFSPELKARAIEELGFNKIHGKKFLYTGRLSQQKNILPLIQAFREFLKNLWINGPPLHCWLL